MAEQTAILWCDHTFNPWIGCSEVDVGCDRCYARAYGKRFGVAWGPNGTRRKTSAANWQKPQIWNRKAAALVAEGYSRARVFPSLCDPFEDWPHPLRHSKGPQLTIRNGQYSPGATKNGFRLATMDDLRRDLFALIDATPNLDWILLTKRPENVLRMWRPIVGGCGGECCEYRSNVWLLYSASTQATLDAGMPELLKCRELVPVLGVSLEPLLERVDLGAAFPCGYYCDKAVGHVDHPFWSNVRPPIDWGAIGGESGSRARPCRVEWICDAVGQFQAANVPVFVKQDSGLRPGQQGRIPDELWNIKEWPNSVQRS